MPSRYNVGNIEIGIISSNDRAIKNLEIVISKLKSFKQIDKNTQNTFNSMNKLANALDKINKIDISLFKKQISDVSNDTKTFSDMLSNIKIGTFSETATSLNKLANALKKINNLKDIDFRKLYTSFNTLTRIISPFLAKLNESKEALQSMATILQKINIQDKNIQEKNFKNNSSFNLSKLFNLGKVYLLYNYSKRIAQQFSKFITYSSDYVEILNKFKVSFQDLYQENLKNVNQLAGAFGFSTNTLLDYTATFNNMLKGLKGLSDETSATISQSLTRMAIDYASIFNVSLDRSMNAFQSAISGNIRTLRSISGFDVSETTIFSIYQQLGGTKTMRQLNQLEKRLLRIIAIQRQMEETGAMGDYGRTIETVSNQIKIFKEQLVEAAKWVGMNLLVYAKPALQYMNAILMTITEIAKSIARTKAEIDNIDYESEFASFGDSVEDVNDAVEELNNSLTTLALDKLNIIGGSSNVSNVSGLSVEGNILNALKEYNMNLDKIQTKSRTISNNILSWLGYTQNINDETGEVEWKLENSNANINKIFAVAKSLLVVLGAIGASKAISNISGMFGQISNPKVGLVITGLVTLLSYFTYLYKNNEDLKSSLDESFSKIKSNLQSIFETLKPVFNFVSDFVSIELKSAVKGIEAITSLLSGDFKGAWEAIKESFSIFFNETFSLIFGKEKWEEFKNTIKKVFTEDIPNFVKSAWESIRKFLFETIPNFFTKTIPNFFIDAINKVIKNLNDVINKTPSWLKGGIIGNTTIPEIPRLAKGGVLSSPTLFMGGEYNNAKTNPEIVTPQNIMRETIVESMLPLVNAILQGDKNLIKAIENKKTDVYLNSRKVSEAMYDDFESVATRKGKILFGQ